MHQTSSPIRYVRLGRLICSLIGYELRILRTLFGTRVKREGIGRLRLILRDCDGLLEEVRLELVLFWAMEEFAAAGGVVS